LTFIRRSNGRKRVVREVPRSTGRAGKTSVRAAVSDHVRCPSARSRFNRDRLRHAHGWRAGRRRCEVAAGPFASRQVPPSWWMRLALFPRRFRRLTTEHREAHDGSRSDIRTSQRSGALRSPDPLFCGRRDRRDFFGLDTLPRERLGRRNPNGDNDGKGRRDYGSPHDRHIMLAW
jgi:hypothetical protein